MKRASALLILLIVLIMPRSVHAQAACTVTSETSHSHSQALSSSILIPVVFHVVHKTNNTGYLTTSEVQSQMSILNSGYSGTNYSFYLAGICRASGHRRQFSLSNLGLSPQDIVDTYHTAAGSNTSR